MKTKSAFASFKYILLFIMMVNEMVLNDFENGNAFLRDVSPANIRRDPDAIQKQRIAFIINQQQWKTKDIYLNVCEMKGNMVNCYLKNRCNPIAVRCIPAYPVQISCWARRSFLLLYSLWISFTITFMARNLPSSPITEPWRTYTRSPTPKEWWANG